MFEISTVSRAGLRELTFALGELVEEHRLASIDETPAERVVIRPKGSEKDFEIKVEGGTYGPVYRILGDKPVKWVQQTDFQNEEAVGYLADRLARLGVEDGLFRAGAVAGATVVIGPGNGIVFDWEPTLNSTAELMTAPAVPTRVFCRATAAPRRSAASSITSAWMPRPMPARSSRPSAERRAPRGSRPTATRPR